MVAAETIPFRVLGPLLVTDGVDQVVINRSRERALLALLLIKRGTAMPRDEMIEMLWEGDPPRNATAALQTAVSRLRRSLGRLSDRVVTTGAGYAISLQTGDFDVEVVEEALERVDAISAESATELLAEIERLWRGPAYEEFRYSDFAQAEVRRLEELRLRVVEERVRSQLGLGQHERLIPELRALVTEDPFHEGLWHSLMLALYRSGRQADSLRAYQEARDHLSDLGIEPGTELMALEMGILQQDPILSVHGRDLSSTEIGEHQSALPRMSGTFFGRHEQLVLLGEGLARPGVTTITGPGGVGKTRLAVEFAERETAALRVEPLFVSVEDVPPGADVSAAAASALSVGPGHSDPIHGLTSWIGPQPRLLILDGVERRVVETAELVEHLTTRLPKLRVLVTSRTPLGVLGESVLSLQPLELGTGSDSARLFVDRAADGTAEHPDADHLIPQIVAAVEGVPLLIELAASRTGSLSLDSIASALEMGADVVDPIPRSGPTRHQSLEATMAWSWDLLPEHLQTALARFSVFAAEFDVASAARLGGYSEESAVADLDALAHHSLVVGGAVPGTGRYRILAPIRAFAARQLRDSGEEGELLSRHAEIVRDFVREGTGTTFKDADPSGWIGGFQRRIPDLVQGFGWLLEHDAEGALELACDLAGFWAKRQEYGRGRRMLQAALARYEGVGRMRARALLWLGVLQIPGRELGSENVSFSHPFRDWRRVERRPVDATSRGREAVTWLRQGVDLAVAAGDDELEIFGRSFLGAALGELGDLERSEQQATIAFKVSEQVPWMESVPTLLASNVALARGDLTRASDLASRALELEGERDDVFQMVLVRDLLARIERARGNYAAAAVHFEVALRDHARPGGQIAGSALLCVGIGLAKIAHGESAEARAFLGEALAIGNEIGMPRIEGVVRRGHALLAMVEGDYPLARHHLERSLEHARSIGSADEVGSTLSRLGQVAEKHGDMAAAEGHYTAAVRTFVPEWPMPDLALALEGLAACRLGSGDQVGATYLLGAAAVIREAVRSPAEWWTSAGATAALARLELGESAFDEAWRSGQSDDLRTVIANALASGQA